MKKDYFSIWSILAAAFAIFLALSTCDEIRVAGLTLKSSGIVDSLLRRPSPAASVAARAAAAQAEPTAPRAVEIDSLPKTILFVGDSMLEGLYPRLAAYCDASGHTLYTVIWYSSTSEAWGRTTKLREYIQRLHPDYIFICLGANELFVKDIAAKREKYVRSVISQIGTIPYIWIGPPNWKEDTGINDLIAANAAPGSYFRSKGMHFDRGKDGAHPTRASAILWMDSVVRWMPRHTSHPIRLLEPDHSTGRARKVFTHSPQEIP